MENNDIEEINNISHIPDDDVYPGLVLIQDFVLLKKIGSGNNATVWLSYHISSNSYVAMKIQDYQCYKDGCREISILSSIDKYCKNTKDKIYCINMIDYFVYVVTDEIQYVCSYYELYAGNLGQLIKVGKYKYGLPIPIVKNILRQILIGINTLHTKLKIIHTDIKPENVLFKGMSDYYITIIDLFQQNNFKEKFKNLQDINNIENDDNQFDINLQNLGLECVYDLLAINNTIYSEEELIPDDEFSDNSNEFDDDDDDDDNINFDINSDDIQENGQQINTRRQSVDDILEYLDYTEMHDLDNDPNYDFTKTLNNKLFSTDKEPIIDDKYVENCEIALTDFGNSYYYKKRTKHEIQDRYYRAPEIILSLDYGYAVDIWSISCLAFELLTGYNLFNPDYDSFNKDIHHLYLFEKMLGPIPIEMKKKSPRKKFLFDKKYNIKNILPFKNLSIKDRLVTQFLFDIETANEITDFLLCGLQYDPLKRSTAEELLNHKWLNNIN